jgi:tetratricopeptide (TPR) repeat protein/tRNA A-37 threonylcarbamoyl transferase component Bud32
MTAVNGQPSAQIIGTWGSLKLIKRVGQGAFGEVYRAFDTTLEREVALKLLLPRGQDRESEEKAMLREARALARIRHPNVVPVYGVGTHDGRVGFWSDFVNGKPLSVLLDSEGPFGAREAALIGIDLCKAVGAVHTAGLLHRDIKTGNVMREAGGRILLMDFGLTHAYDAGQSFSGTPVYMAPELLTGAPASIASDIYALGVLLFHLLTGKYPIDGPSIREIKSAHESGRRLTLLDIRPDLPQQLAHVVEVAANPDPAKRYRSTGQMIAALTEAAGLGPVAAGSEQRTARRFRWWILAAVAAAVAILLTAPQVRSLFFVSKTASEPIAGVHDDYQKAHDLLEHYYRPHALETAIPLLEKTVQQDPRFAPAFADLGRANVLQFIHLDDPRYIEPSRQASLQALNLEPDLVSAHVSLGVLYTWTDKQDLASQELDEALRLDKYNAAAYGGLAELAYRQGRNDEAESTLQKAINLAPENWGLLQQLGEYYLETGKLAQAAEQYQNAANLAPDNSRAYNNLGLVYRKQGRTAAAEAAFRKVIDLDPTARHYRNLGTVFLDEGKYAEAQPMFERATSLQPDYYEFWGYLATVYRNTGVDRAKIEEAYRKAIALSADLRKQTPHDPDLLADVGGYYAAIGMEDDSVRLLKQAAALAPDKPDVLYQVAVGYERLHRRDQALLWIDKAIAGGISAQLVERVPELASLRADPRYKSILNKAD